MSLVLRFCQVGRLDAAENNWRRGVTLALPTPSLYCIQSITMSTLKAAILVVSTTASKDPSADSSGATLKDVFESDGGGKWVVLEKKIVGDDVLDIQRSITGWTDCEDAVNVIITTGGTGFAVSDNTPEVSEVWL